MLRTSSEARRVRLARNLFGKDSSTEDEVVHKNSESVREAETPSLETDFDTRYRNDPWHWDETLFS